jgi:Icc-related predicted phosphoesterase
VLIDSISDLHGHYPELEGGDLLIVAGDLTARDQPHEYAEFIEWIQKQKYTKKIVITGNHDGFIEAYSQWAALADLGFEYLFDSVTEFEGLKIWGSPWTKTFPGMNPHCKAFTVDTEEELYDKFVQIPHDTDILVTHSPPASHLDRTIQGFNVGSSSLKCITQNNRIWPQLWVWGHIHESYGIEYVSDSIFVNASIVNERYQPVNKPIRIVL